MSFEVVFVVDGDVIADVAGSLGDLGGCSGCDILERVTETAGGILGDGLSALSKGLTFRLTGPSSPFTWGNTQRRMLEEAFYHLHRALTPSVSGWDLSLEVYGGLADEIFGAIQVVAKEVAAIAGIAYNLAKQACQAALEFFQQAGQFIKDAFSAVAASIANFIKNPVDFLFQTVLGGLNTGINAIQQVFKQT